MFEPQGSAGTRNLTFGAPGRGAPEFVFHHPVLLRPSRPCLTLVGPAPGRSRFPRRPDGSCRRASSPFPVTCHQRRHRPGRGRAASIVSASLRAASRPHRYSLAHPSWFFVPHAPRTHGRSSCAHRGKRAPALPSRRRRLQRMARPRRRACPRRRGLSCVVRSAAPHPAPRGRRGSGGAPAASSSRRRHGPKARGPWAEPTPSGVSATRTELPRSPSPARSC